MKPETEEEFMARLDATLPKLEDYMNTEPQDELLDHMENLFVPQTPELAMAVIKNLDGYGTWKVIVEALARMKEITNDRLADEFLPDTDDIIPAMKGACDLNTIIIMMNCASMVRMWKEEM